MQEATELRGNRGIRLGGEVEEEWILDERNIPGNGANIHMPSAVNLWDKAFILIWIGVAYMIWTRVATLLMDYWLLDRLGFEDVFWTNFWTGTVLFVIGAAITSFELLIPTLVYKLPRPASRFFVQVALMVDLFVALYLAQHYMDFLLLLNSVSFGETDPVFGHDISFYVFTLPAIRDIMAELTIISVSVGILSSACAYVANRHRARTDMHPVMTFLGIISSPITLGAIGLFGLVQAINSFLARYSLLTKDNYDSSVYVGAQVLDVTGFFSTVNSYYLGIVVALGITAAAIYVLRILNRAVMTDEDIEWREPARKGGLVIVGLFAVSLLFGIGIGLRDRISINPNEPVVQFTYIQRHIDATRAAYGMDEVEVVDFSPNEGNAPHADAATLLNSPVLKNVALWEGSISMLEPQVDPEYVERILNPQIGTWVANSTLEAFRNNQKLRPYYDFMDIDTLRYRVNGVPTIYASAVRELPLVEPKPWLTWWGQMYVLLTHGQGLVMSPVAEKTPEGDPIFTVASIPPETSQSQLRVNNNAIYYGEGSGTVAFSNIKGLKELDYPTAQGRAEVILPPEDATSVKVDSPLKRLVFAWHSGQFSDIFFSDLIQSDTHIHYSRLPIERVNRIAPFLHFDSDPFAFAADGSIYWMLNGMTTSKNYPYSMMGDLGEKSTVRTTYASTKSHLKVNYVRDSVKGVINAASGEVTFYQISNEPIVRAWSNVYPDLFKDGDEMPANVRAQMQFPYQLFHLQFDDLYIYYHMTTPTEFFNLEDMFDDGNEILGPMFTAGPAIGWSIEPYYWIADTQGGAMPRSSERYQFTKSQIFTPEGADNLRAIVNVYQDGSDYGKQSLLQVPKGHFFWGPEQAESIIDQNPRISQQFQDFSRQGTLVVRGHLTPLVIGNEMIYVEPIFIRSQQLEVPQLKKIVVVYRGVARMGDTLEDALRSAIDDAKTGNQVPAAPSAPVAPVAAAP